VWCRVFFGTVDPQYPAWSIARRRFNRSAFPVTSGSVFFGSLIFRVDQDCFEALADAVVDIQDDAREISIRPRIPE